MIVPFVLLLATSDAGRIPALGPGTQSARCFTSLRSGYRVADGDRYRSRFVFELFASLADGTGDHR